MSKNLNRGLVIYGALQSICIRINKFQKCLATYNDGLAYQVGRWTTTTTHVVTVLGVCVELILAKS